MRPRDQVCFRGRKKVGLGGRGQGCTRRTCFTKKQKHQETSSEISLASTALNALVAAKSLGKFPFNFSTFYSEGRQETNKQRMVLGKSDYSVYNQTSDHSFETWDFSGNWICTSFFSCLFNKYRVRDKYNPLSVHWKITFKNAYLFPSLVVYMITMFWVAQLWFIQKSAKKKN